MTDSLRNERQLRRADAYMASALDQPRPLRTLEEVASDARRWALDIRNGKTVLDEEFFATIFELISDLADHLRADA